MSKVICIPCLNLHYHEHGYTIIRHSHAKCSHCDVLGGEALKVVITSGKKEEEVIDFNGSLFDADPKCNHEVICAPGGGVKCRKCRGWFCY